MGANGGVGRTDLRRRLARGPLAGRRRPGRGRRADAQAHQDRSSPSSTRRSLGSRRCWPARPTVVEVRACEPRTTPWTRWFRGSSLALLAPQPPMAPSGACAPAAPRRRDPGSGGAEHLVAQAYGVSAGGDERRYLVVGEPALGADHDHDLAGLRDRERASDSVASSCSTTARSARRPGSTHVGGGGQLRDLRVPGPPRLLGRLARGRPPLRQRLRRPLALPHRHAARRRPGHDLGDADLGEHLDRELAAVALRQRLHHGDGRRRLGHHVVRRQPHVEGPLAGGVDLAARRAPRDRR